MRIVAGLGNPGRKYADTRHNVGWMALDALAERCGVGPDEYVCDGVRARCGELWLFKPLGYMNRSGPPVARLMQQEGVGPQDLLVLVDDLNLPLGAIRVRGSGSSGGHRGLESLIETLVAEEFPRLRMGIGPLPPGTEARDFVLRRFEPDERELADGMAQRAAEAVLCWATEGLASAMNRFNRRLEDASDSQNEDLPPTGSTDNEPRTTEEEA